MKTAASKTVIFALLFCLACGNHGEQRGVNAAAPPIPHTPWTHFRGNTELDGVNLKAPISDTLKLAWTFKAGGAFLSSPVTDGSSVYIGSHDSVLYALDINSGKSVWKFKARDEIDASPLIYDSVILIGDLDGNFYSINKNDGSMNWAFETNGKITGAANIIEEKGYVIFGSHDFNLYCLNIGDGGLVWKYRSGSYVNGTPAVNEGRIIFGGCDGELHILNAADGAKIGKVDVESYIAGSGVFKNNWAYIGTYGKKLLGIDIVGMKAAWAYENDGRKEPFFASPALIDTFLVAPSRDKFVHCVSPATGNLIWKFAAKGPIDASPVISGNRVIVGCGAGTLYLIDLKTGELVSSFDMGGGLDGTPLASGGMVIVGDVNGTLSALRYY